VPLHRLLGIDIGVPYPQTLDDFYREIGFVGERHVWGPAHDPSHLRVEEAPYRQLVTLRLACHDEADLAAIGRRLDERGIAHSTADGQLRVVDPVNRWTVTVEPRPVEDVPEPPSRPAQNRPGNRPRTMSRPEVMTEAAPRPPRRLGHVVIGTPDVVHTHDLYVNALGFRVSDIVAGGLAWFTRCSPDHHNLLIAPGPVPYLNHYAVELDDIDAVMKSAGRYLASHPGTHVSGPGRHPIGGNVFWYVQDPAGNIFEQFADMDCIPDDRAWQPEDWKEPAWTLWGKERQPELFFAPRDMADLIHGFHRQHG
jgi:catechol 2,3-dioxygenase-like lactoylglutathione lyase family enzyme